MFRPQTDCLLIYLMTLLHLLLSGSKGVVGFKLIVAKEEETSERVF